MPFCGSTTLTLHAPDHVIAHRLHCKCWECDDCFPLRLGQLKQLAAAGNPTKFITLNINPDHWDSPDEAARALVVAWRNIRQRARRDGLADRIPFLAIFEETKRGWPHLHILARCPVIPWDWLSARSKEYLGTHLPHISQIHSQSRAKNYVAKYVSKAPQRYDGCKRYFQSLDWRIDRTDYNDGIPVHDRDALYHSRSLESVADSYRRSGWIVVRTAPNDWEAWPGSDLAVNPWFDAYLWRGSGLSFDYVPGRD